MIECKLKGNTFFLFVLLLVSFLVFSSNDLFSQTGSRMDEKADRYFIRGDYEESMICHELNLDSLSKDNPSYYPLELKIAQLYSVLQNKPETIAHYDNVYQNMDSLLSINDIYLFVDALRRSSLFEQAESVVRHYAAKGGIYASDHRFLNILNSLLNLVKDDESNFAEYDLRLLDSASIYSNYWIGSYASEPFFAQSRSGELSSNDKIIYHQTRFRKLGDSIFDGEKNFKDIPYQLQHGAMAYHEGKKLLIATDIFYQPNDRKTLENVITQGYSSSLLYSRYDSIRNIWAAFKPVFDTVQNNSSYAHPSLFNDGNSLIFSSNRPDGHGGMDLYVAHWNEESGVWSEPENLGQEVNSNGDELYPRINNDTLLFSSNGFEGFGGFDNYRISLDGASILRGTIYHYPFPINSVYNDFGAWFYKDNGFFISDRKENGRDDIFVLQNVSSFFSYFMKDTIVQEVVVLVDEGQTPISNTAEEFDIIIRKLIDQISELSIYFEFDSQKLTAKAQKQLEEIRKDIVADEIREIRVLGYADLIGSEEYNQKLSMRRAKEVAKYFQKHFPEASVIYDGRGKMNLSEEEEQNIRKYIKDVLADKVDLNSIKQGGQSLKKHSSRKSIIALFERYRRVEIEIKTITELKE